MSKEKILVLFHPDGQQNLKKSNVLRIQINMLFYIFPTNAKLSPGFEHNPAVGRPTHCFLSLLT